MLCIIGCSFTEKGFTMAVPWKITSLATESANLTTALLPYCPISPIVDNRRSRQHCAHSRCSEDLNGSKPHHTTLMAGTIWPVNSISVAKSSKLGYSRHQSTSTFCYGTTFACSGADDTMKLQNGSIVETKATSTMNKVWSATYCCRVSARATLRKA